MKCNVTGLGENDGEVFPVLDTGSYPVRITEIKDSETKGGKNPGSPMINIKAVVMQGEDDEGHVLFTSRVMPTDEMEPKTRNFHTSNLKRLCVACGLEQEDDEFDTDDLMGKEFVAVVVLKTVEGQKKNEIKDCLPLD